MDPYGEDLPVSRVTVMWEYRSNVRKDVSSRAEQAAAAGARVEVKFDPDEASMTATFVGLVGAEAASTLDGLDL